MTLTFVTRSSRVFLSASLLMVFLVSGNMLRAQGPTTFEPSEDWKPFMSMDGVQIDYCMRVCNPDGKRDKNLLLFKISNQTTQNKTISWTTKMWRNDQCANCTTINSPEFSHQLSLGPNEVIEGTGSLDEDRALHVFGNFIKLVPGMSEQRLTNVELLNVTVE